MSVPKKKFQVNKNATVAAMLLHSDVETDLEPYHLRVAILSFHSCKLSTYTTKMFKHLQKKNLTVTKSKCHNKLEIRIKENVTQIRNPDEENET